MFPYLKIPSKNDSRQQTGTVSFHVPGPCIGLWWSENSSDKLGNLGSTTGKVWPGRCFLVFCFSWNSKDLSCFYFNKGSIRTLQTPQNTRVQSRKWKILPLSESYPQDRTTERSGVNFPHTLICICKQRTFYNLLLHSIPHSMLMKASQWSRLAFKTVGKGPRQETVCYQTTEKLPSVKHQCFKN